MREFTAVLKAQNASSFNEILFSEGKPAGGMKKCRLAGVFGRQRSIVGQDQGLRGDRVARD